MDSATYEQLQVELRYVTWQRDRLAEVMREISRRWSRSPNDEYRTKGEAIADIILAITGDEK